MNLAPRSVRVAHFREDFGRGMIDKGIIPNPSFFLIPLPQHSSAISGVRLRIFCAPNPFAATHLTLRLRAFALKSSYYEQNKSQS
jgi:hypothetical protein